MDPISVDPDLQHSYSLHNGVESAHRLATIMFRTEFESGLGFRISVGQVTDLDSNESAIRLCLSIDAGFGGGETFSTLTVGKGVLTRTISNPFDQIDLSFETDIAAGDGTAFIKGLIPAEPEQRARITGLALSSAIAATSCVDINARGLIDRAVESLRSLVDQSHEVPQATGLRDNASLGELRFGIAEKKQREYHLVDPKELDIVRGLRDRSQTSTIDAGDKGMSKPIP